METRRLITPILLSNGNVIGDFTTGSGVLDKRLKTERIQLLDDGELESVICEKDVVRVTGPSSNDFNDAERVFTISNETLII